MYQLADTTGGFSSPTQLGTSLSPHLSFDFGDVDGNNMDDVITLLGNGDVVVWFQLTHLDFGQVRIVEAWPNPGQIALGLLDGDGFLDVIVMASGSQPTSGLVVWMGPFSPNSIGNGRHEDAVTLVDEVISGEHLMTAALTVPSRKSDVLYFDGAFDGSYITLLNRGDGRFSVSETGALTADPQVPPVVADLDGDKALDVFLLIRDGSIRTGWWYPNAGFGPINSPRIPAIPVAPVSLVTLVIDDLNGDGVPDIAGASSLTPSLFVYPGNGSVPPLTWSSDLSSLSDGMTGLVPADFDNSGTLDLVYSSERGDSLGWIPNNGDLVFSPPRELDNNFDEPLSIGVGDLDGDGLLDVAAPTGYRYISWLKTNGRGRVVGGQRVVTDDADYGKSVYIVDLNYDNINDIVYTDENDDDVAYVLGNTLGGFDPQVLVSSGEINYPKRMVLEDVNTDGFVDLVVASNYDEHIVWFPNDGTASFGPSQAVVVNTPTSNDVTDLAAGDMNGDGLPDVVASLESVDQVRIYTQVRDLAFSPPAISFLPHVVAFQGTQNVDVVEVLDLDNDGVLDVAAGDRLGVYLVHNLGNATFSPTSATTLLTLPSSSTMTGLLAADFNGDGFTELITSYRNGGGAATSLFSITPLVGSPTRSVLLLPSSLSRMSQLESIIGSLSRCRPHTLRLAVGTRIRVCKSDGPVVIPFDVSLTIESEDPMFPASIDCGPSGGSLFAVQGRLNLVHLLLANGSSVPSEVSPLSVSFGYLTLTSVTLAEFRSVGGGPLSLDRDATVVVENSVVTFNTGLDGPGFADILGINAVLIIRNSTLSANTALGSPSPFSGGGVVSVNAFRARVLIYNSVLEANAARAGASGGAILVTPNARDTTLLVDGTVLSRNTAPLGLGGALAMALGSGTATFQGGETRVDTSYAAFGGALAVFPSTTGWGFPERVSSSAVAPFQAGAEAALENSASDSAVITLTRGASLGSNSAAFGGTLFVCGSSSTPSGPSIPSINITDDAGSFGSSSAQHGGGFAFFCLQTPLSTGPGLEWISISDVLMSTLTLSDVSRATWGPLFATPPLPPLTIEGIEGAENGCSVSATPLNRGVVHVRDAFGAVVVDTTLELIVVYSDNDAGTTTTTTTVTTPVTVNLGSGMYDLGALIVGAPYGAFDPVAGTASADVEISLVTSPTSLSGTSISVCIQACPPTQGRVSLDEPGSTLLCGPCGASAFSDSLSVDSCALIPACLEGSVRADPASNRTSPGGVLLCVCAPGWYENSFSIAEKEEEEEETEEKEEDGVCSPCPQGAVCAGGSSRPSAAPGYFPDADSGGTVFTQCLRAASCLGNGQCAEGYTGRLCAACARNYYSLNGQCYACDPSRTAVITSVLVLACVVFLFVLVGVNLSTSVYHRFAVFLISVAALQISAMFGRLDDLDFGPVADVYFQVVSLFNLNLELTSPECSVSSSVDVWVFKWVLTLMLPLFAAVVLFGLVLPLGLGAQAAGLGPSFFLAQSSSSVVWTIVRTMFQVVVLLYLPLISTVLSLFGCESTSSGRSVMSSAPERDCFDSTWWSLFPVALIALLVYGVGVPLALYLVVSRARRVLDPVDLVLRYGFVVARFVDSAWWFELAILARKAVVVFAITVFSSDGARANGAVLVLGGSLIQLLLHKPYRSVFHNLVAVLVLLATLVIVLAGTFSSKPMRRACVTTALLFSLLIMVVGNAIDVWLQVKQEVTAELDWFFGSPETVGVVEGGASKVESSSFQTLELDDLGSQPLSQPDTAQVGSVGFVSVDGRGVESVMFDDGDASDACPSGSPSGFPSVPTSLA